MTKCSTYVYSGKNVGLALLYGLRFAARHGNEYIVIIGSDNALFGAKPLPDPMLTYCRVNQNKWVLVKTESK